MGQRLIEQANTEVADEIRDILRHALKEGGWTSARIASDMQILGQKGWNESTVFTTANGKRQTLNIDEALALLAVFGGRSRLIIQKVEALTEKIIAATDRRGNPGRRDTA
jgi:hypothetical protein